jgi:hypothetical protein
MLISTDQDISNALIASCELEKEKRSHDKTTAQLMRVVSSLQDAMTLFEYRFDSDPSELTFDEMDWYINAALVCQAVTGRANIVDKIASARYSKITGTGY